MPKILVVDDNSDILAALKIIFEGEGFEVKATLHGSDAYKIAGAYHPDVIILDMLLSGVNGLTICNSLKRDDRTKNIPIIMISAHPSARDLSMAAGADMYFAKPFELDSLVHSVKRLVHAIPQ